METALWAPILLPECSLPSTDKERLEALAYNKAWDGHIYNSMPRDG